LARGDLTALLKAARKRTGGLAILSCLAVVLNDRQDYFGTTVNIAARVETLADSRTILATRSVVTDPQASGLLETSGLKPVSQSRALRGIADEVAVYEIP
jgi:class 3 adenylate cyclase